MASPDPVGELTRSTRRVSVRRNVFRHERYVLLLALGSGAGGVLLSIALLWSGDYDVKTRWIVAALLVVAWFAFALATRAAVMRPLQTLSNMLGAIREGDFTLRARGASYDDSLGELMMEINALSDALQHERLGALEASAMLRKVMEVTDVAMLTFDDQHRLRLLNRAGERLLGQPAERLLGRTAAEVGVEDWLTIAAPQTREHTFPGGSSQWGVRHTMFRQGGVPHHLLIISDLSSALRQEERQAWQRLVRVLGHELNNSLAPIKSIAESLRDLLRREPRPAGWEDDLRHGLNIITERSEALTRFMRDYSRLTRLPKPQLQWVEIGALMRRVAALESRLAVEVVEGPEVRIQADPDQLEQLLINVLRNAVDATLENGKRAVTTGWQKDRHDVCVFVRDEGRGIANPANLFVPFFTTKPNGSGIGLALSRQIAEAHQGTLILQNRQDGMGSIAQLRLPVGLHESAAQ
ncbi:MAG: ATP-binding protein [Acidobacteriales bacterium]|nr:ATP-binding protein [Terriglobales bacterium]